MAYSQHHTKVSTGLLCLGVFFMALDQGDAAFTLKTKCEVNGDGVYLSDLVEPEADQAVPALLIDRSPTWGVVREYSVEELMGLIRGKALGINITGTIKGNKIIITRSARRLDSNEVLLQLRGALINSPVYGEGELELDFLRPWKTLLVPDGPLEIKILTKINYATSQTSLRFQLLDGGVPFGVFSASVKISLWKDAWVATGAITRGTVLSRSELEKQRVDAIKVRQDLWDGNPADGRFWFRENISPGRLVYTRAVEMKPVVRRGDLAKAVISTGTLLVSTNVKVLEDGAPGEVVRIQNVKTRKEMVGEVLDEKTIKISTL
jgi:flagella basal body P-ring formation protein FlgA